MLIYINSHAYVSVHTRVCMYACVGMHDVYCTYVYMYIHCTYTSVQCTLYIRVCVCTRVWLRTRVRMYVHTYALGYSRQETR